MPNLIKIFPVDWKQKDVEGQVDVTSFPLLHLMNFVEKILHSFKHKFDQIDPGFCRRIRVTNDTIVFTLSYITMFMRNYYVRLMCILRFSVKVSACLSRFLAAPEKQATPRASSSGDDV
jgi:hypothetical protein